MNKTQRPRGSGASIHAVKAPAAAQPAPSIPFTPEDLDSLDKIGTSLDMLHELTKHLVADDASTAMMCAVELSQERFLRLYCRLEERLAAAETNMK